MRLAKQCHDATKPGDSDSFRAGKSTVRATVRDGTDGTCNYTVSDLGSPEDGTDDSTNIAHQIPMCNF